MVSSRSNRALNSLRSSRIAARALRIAESSGMAVPPSCSEHRSSAKDRRAVNPKGEPYYDGLCAGDAIEEDGKSLAGESIVARRLHPPDVQAGVSGRLPSRSSGLSGHCRYQGARTSRNGPGRCGCACASCADQKVGYSRQSFSSEPAGSRLEVTAPRFILGQGWTGGMCGIGSRRRRGRGRIRRWTPPINCPWGMIPLYFAGFAAGKMRVGGSLVAHCHG